MGSPNQYPPITPPPYRSRRSIAGPLILIAIGVVFLLSNLGVIRRWEVWNWFGHWWPVLLILWGVIVLIENMVAPRAGYRTRRLGVGGVLLLVLLVILGVSAHYSSQVNWNGVRDQFQVDGDFGGIFGNAYTFEDTLQQPFPAQGSLRIVCDHGSLNITPSADNAIHVVVHKKLYAQKPERCQQIQPGHQAADHVNGNLVVLNANTDGAGDHGVQTDMDISVPAGDPARYRQQAWRCHRQQSQGSRQNRLAARRRFPDANCRAR